MHLLFTLSFVLAVSVVGYAYWRYATRLKLGTAGSVEPRPFMTGNETEFFNRLTHSLPEFHVFPQVSMGALVQPTVPPGHPDFWRIRDTFGQKVCDFVVCERKTLAPLFIVELDDKTHSFDKDAKRDNVSAHGGLWTVRFWSRSKPNHAEIRQRVSRVLGPRVGFQP